MVVVRDRGGMRSGGGDRSGRRMVDVEKEVCEEDW